MASGVLTGTEMIKKKFVQARITELTEGYMVTDAIFKAAPTDALSIVYEENTDGLNSWEASDEVEERTEMGQYPRIGMDAKEKQAMIKDYGLEVEISYNAIKHNKISSIDRAYMKLGNSLMKFVDTKGLEKLTDNYNTSSTRIHTQVAGVAWDQAGADPFSDFANAKAKVDGSGYVADIVAVNPLDWTKALTNKDFRQELDRDLSPNDKIVKSGILYGKIAGLVVVAARNLTPGHFWVGQKQMIGDRNENTSGVQTDSYKKNNSTKSPTIVSSFREFEDVLTDPKAGCLGSGI